MYWYGEFFWSASSSRRSRGPSPPPRSLKGAFRMPKIWTHSDTWGFSNLLLHKVFEPPEWCSDQTCLRMFCSLISFCLSRLALLITMSSTGWPLLMTSATKKTTSSSSLMANLTKRKQWIWRLVNIIFPHFQLFASGNSSETISASRLSFSSPLVAKMEYSGMTVASSSLLMIYFSPLQSKKLRFQSALSYI